MPDDYYVSQYSGEEIDALLGGAGTGTVRYDAAQTLTDAQKQQARANIAAAPDGFGLGPINRVVTDFDTAKLNGWYYGAAGTAHAPDSENSWSVLATNIANSSDICIQDAYTLINVNRYLHCRRLVYVDTDTQNNPWEWVDPPMYLGVEYRTTERYKGKPVYVKLVDFEKLPNNAAKEVAHGISNMQYAISVTGESNGDNLIGNMYITYVHIGTTNITIRTNADRSGVSATVLIKYTKTTD